MMSEVWETSQLGWLPIRLARRPEELETQAQLDALVERAVAAGVQPRQRAPLHRQREVPVGAAAPHPGGRGLPRAVDPRLPRHGTAPAAADRLGFDQVYHGYLKALTERVRAYDATGKLPVYMIFLDQNFYEPNAGRIWMSFLEDPLRNEIDLPRGPDAEEQESKIREAQAELREAVAELAAPAGAAAQLRRRLARQPHQGARQHHQSRGLVVLEPAGDSRARHPGRADARPPQDLVLRRHGARSRAEGEAIFTGMGIGEHYAGPTWEDRAILVQGPSLVGLKDAARQLLRSQGFAEDEVPYPLPSPAQAGELRRARRGPRGGGHRLPRDADPQPDGLRAQADQRLQGAALRRHAGGLDPDRARLALEQPVLGVDAARQRAARRARLHRLAGARERPERRVPADVARAGALLAAPGRQADHGRRDRPPGRQPESRDLRGGQGRRRSPRTHRSSSTTR